MMDRNSCRTSVVIEVANQEEPEDQKTYQIDFDDLDLPKDYLIDKVFCGENITVYALFEVPEDANITTNEKIPEVSNAKTHEGCKFFHSKSTHKIMNQRQLHGFKQKIINSDESVVNVVPNKEIGSGSGSGSFYCLKHLSSNYDMLTPERENSELKVLFSKSAVSKNSKLPKFKGISKGVNTDIVQSPKIIHEVQKAVKQNLPNGKTEKNIAEFKSISSNKPSYEVIEMEMRQSFSSLSSYGEGKKVTKKSVPNFFLVPLLMMDDGVLSHFQSDDKVRKFVVEKGIKTPVAPEKVSKGINTDLLMFELEKDKSKNNETSIEESESEGLKSGDDVNENQSNSTLHPKLYNKNTIVREIKYLRERLNALIKSIEMNGISLDTSEGEAVEMEGVSLVKKQEEPEAVELQSNLELSEESRTNLEKFDDLPVPPKLCPSTSLQGKEQQESSSEEQPEVDVAPEKLVSVSTESGEESTEMTGNQSESNYQDEKSEEELKKLTSICSIIWSEMDNRRGAGLSKSTTSLGFPDPKFNGLRKSFSFDLRDMKLEVTCLKKIKNNSFKLEAKPNKRIPQKGETNLKCEMGDEAVKKSKPSRIDLLEISKAIEKSQNTDLQKALESKKNVKEKGDAKLEYSKQNLLFEMISRNPENIEVHFCNTINTTPRNALLTETALLPNPVKSKGTCNVTDTDSEKPTTPNKNSRKTNPSNLNAKKEAKAPKKANNPTSKIKIGEKVYKPEGKEGVCQEVAKQRSVTGSRKFPLKGTAESKLHLDRLMKTENLVSARSTEKPGIKLSRFFCQKRETVESPTAVEVSKEQEEKITKTDSNDLLKETKESVARLEKREETSEKSRVVVELFSKKPKSVECLDDKGLNLVNEDVISEEDSKVQKEVKDEAVSSRKPVVTSVWALTKVLLFEDGTKKIEILEASLNPPGHLSPKNRSRNCDPKLKI